MALSVTVYEPSSWGTTGSATRTVTGVAWSSGDIIVVMGGTEGADTTMATPTNANLTFSLRASVTAGGTNECPQYCWSAAAASGQTAQTISCVITNGTKGGNICVWVITGGPTGITGAVANQTETAFSMTPAAGDVVVYQFFDWNAAGAPTKTPLTGSGTGTEREDQVYSTFGVWCADWVGTSAGTFNFGPNNYTSMKVAQAAIIVQAPTGGTTTFTHGSPTVDAQAAGATSPTALAITPGSPTVDARASGATAPGSLSITHGSPTVDVRAAGATAESTTTTFTHGSPTVDARAAGSTAPGALSITHGSPTVDARAAAGVSFGGLAITHGSPTVDVRASGTTAIVLPLILDPLPELLPSQFSAVTLDDQYGVELLPAQHTAVVQEI